MVTALRPTRGKDQDETNWKANPKKLYFEISNSLSLIGPFTLARSLKCGTTSIFETLSQDQHLIPPDADKMMPRVFSDQVRGNIHLFVRDPIDRLKSAWQFFADVDPQAVQSSWERFVDAVLAGAENRHWYSQTLTHTWRGVFLPTHLHPFEDINQIWPTLIRRPIGQENMSIVRNVDRSYRRAELETFYADDMVLRARL